MIRNQFILATVLLNFVADIIYGFPFEAVKKYILGLFRIKDGACFDE